MTTHDEEELDELLQPTIPAEPRGPLPWNIRSQFWVAFFGGAAASTLVAYANGRRLGLPRARQRLILITGLIGMLVAAAAVVWLFWVSIGNNGSKSRMAARVIGVLVYLVHYYFQREADTRHQIFGGGEYDSLWRIGLGAVVVGWLFTAAVAVVAIMTKGMWL